MLRKGFAKSVWGLSFARAVGAVLGAAIFFFLAKWLGAGAATDAFFLVRRFITGLAASIERTTVLVLIPSIVDSLVAAEDGRHRPSPLRPAALGFLLACLAGLALFFGAPWVVKALAPGFEDERLELAAHLLRIVAAMVPLTVAAAVATSYLNAARRYAMPEYLSHLPRVAIILAILLLPAVTVEALTWAMLLGTAMAVALLVPAVVRTLHRARRRPADAEAAPTATPRTGLGRRITLAGITQLQLQGTTWIDAAFASMIGIGALSLLEYAQRLVWLLPSLLGSSLLVVAFTEMSYAAARSDRELFRRNMVAAVRANLFLILPVAVVLAGTADLLVSILLQHGEFTAEAAARTTEVVRLTLPYLTITAISGAITTALVADAWLPSRRILLTAVLAALGGRLVIFWFVVEPFGLPGLALGSAAAAALMLATLLAFLAHYCRGLFVAEDWLAFGGTVAASLAAAAAIVAARQLLAPLEGGILGDFASLALSSAFAGAAFCAAAFALRLREMELIGAHLLRRKLRRAA